MVSAERVLGGKACQFTGAHCIAVLGQRAMQDWRGGRGGVSCCTSKSHKTRSWGALNLLSACFKAYPITTAALSLSLGEENRAEATPALSCCNSSAPSAALSCWAYANSNRLATKTRPATALVPANASCHLLLLMHLHADPCAARLSRGRSAAAPARPAAARRPRSARTPCCPPSAAAASAAPPPAPPLLPQASCSAARWPAASQPRGAPPD